MLKIYLEDKSNFLIFVRLIIEYVKVSLCTIIQEWEKNTD